jgi:DNA-directed RNA polymerase omega subunit
MNEKTRMLNDVAAGEEQWPGIDSRYRLIVVAAMRAKQLQRGAHPRIEADTRRRRNTSIAIEETKLGLVPFTSGNVKGGADGADGDGGPADNS